MEYKSGQIVKTIAYQVIDVPIMYHFGVIYVDEITNEVFVLHNSGDEESTIKEPFDDFILERELVELQPSKLENLTNEELLIRFENCKGEFDVLDYNCEHFIDCMMGDKKRSEQVVLYALVAITLYLIYK